MKRFLFTCSLLLAAVCGFSGENLPFEENTYEYEYYDELGVDHFFSFKDGKLFIQYNQDEPTKRLKDSIESKLHPGYYYTAKNEDYEIVHQKDYIIAKTKSCRYLVYYYKSEFCVLVDMNNGTHYWGRNITDRILSPGVGRPYFPGIWSPDWTTVHQSSFLIEKTQKGEVQYAPKGFYQGRIDIPWVEGVKSYGIGEWVEMGISGSTSKFLIFNGFTYLDDLDFYYYNSRVKKLDVVVDGETYSYSLEDTPQIQIVQLPRMIKGKTVRFIIQDVYKGEKYDDTSISNISYLISE